MTSSPVAAFTSGGPPRKIVPLPLTMTVSSRHRRHVRAARRARTHHGGNLRNAFARHARLIVKNAPEVFAIGKDFGLQRQERAARIDEIDARQMILLGDLLRAQMFFDRHRIVRAAFDGGVVGDDDAVLPFDDADAGDNSRRRRRIVGTCRWRPAPKIRENPNPASIERSMRSRAVSLSRLRCFAIASGPPPARTAIRRSRNSATRRSMRSALRSKVSEPLETRFQKSHRRRHSALAASFRCRLGKLSGNETRVRLGAAPRGRVARCYTTGDGNSPDDRRFRRNPPSAGASGRRTALDAYPGPLDEKLAAHLLRRAGFGGSPDDVRRYAGMPVATRSNR